MKYPCKGDRKIKDGIEIICLSYADGYVMWRYAATYPWIMTLRTWNDLASLPRQKELINA